MDAGFRANGCSSSANVRRRALPICGGWDLIDPLNGGFVSAPGGLAERYGWRYDTRLPGNGNAGHEGPAYGTGLSAADKDALIEFLKTF